MTRLPSKTTIPMLFVVLFVLFVALPGRAKAPPANRSNALLIKPVKASYIERDRGNALSIACTLINDGDSDITVVTENLNFGGSYIDQQNNSLQCVLLFESSIRTTEGNPIIPSLCRHAPVTLRPGDAAMMHYYRDYSKRITGSKSMDKDKLKAETVTISYKVSKTWGDRFNIWHGEVKAEPVKFNKLLR